MQVDIWKNILKKLVELCESQPAKSSSFSWAHEIVIKLYTAKCSLLAAVFSCSSFISHIQTQYKFRHPATSFPEFVFKSQMRINYKVLGVSEQVASRYAMREDDMQVFRQLSSHVFISQDEVLTMVMYKSYDVLAAYFADYVVDDGKTFGSTNNLRIPLMGDTIDVVRAFLKGDTDNIYGKGYFPFDQSADRVRYRLLQGWMFDRKIALSTLLSDERIMRAPGTLTLIYDVACNSDYADVVGELLQRKLVNYRPGQGGLAIIALYISEGYMDAVGAIRRLKGLMDFRDIGSISFVAFLEETDGFFTKEQYQIIAKCLICRGTREWVRIGEGHFKRNKNEEGRSAYPEALLWMATKGYLNSSVIKHRAARTQDKLLMTRRIVPTK